MPHVDQAVFGGQLSKVPKRVLEVFQYLAIVTIGTYIKHKQKLEIRVNVLHSTVGYRLRQRT